MDGSGPLRVADISGEAPLPYRKTRASDRRPEPPWGLTGERAVETWKLR